MGIFGRKPNAGFTPGQIQAVDQLMRERAAEALTRTPRTFPDGSPFPADRLVHGLTSSMRRTLLSGAPDVLAQAFNVPLALLFTLGDADSGPRADVVQRLLDHRAALANLGLGDEAEAVRAAQAACDAYWQQTGALDRYIHQVVRGDVTPPTD